MRFLIDSGYALGDCALDIALLRTISRHGHQNALMFLFCWMFFKVWGKWSFKHLPMHISAL